MNTIFKWVDALARAVIALIGTGLATVALGLLAWEMAGEDAGLVLGTAFRYVCYRYIVFTK